MARKRERLGKDDETYISATIFMMFVIGYQESDDFSMSGSE